MAMIVDNKLASLDTLNNYGRITDNMQKSVLHISSGMRINSVADDPTSWVASERMRERIRSLDQANQNAQNDTSMLRTAEGAIGNTVEIINTLKAKAISALDVTLGDEGKEVIQYEVKQLINQINNNAAQTTYGGQKLLDGTWSDGGLNFHIGGEANFSVPFEIENMSADALGLGNLDFTTYDGAMSALGVRNADGTYSDYSIETEPGTGRTTRRYGLIETALNKALSMQARVGAMEERLGYARENLSTSSENLQNANSLLVDTDVAKEMTQYVKWSILSQASQYMIAQQNQNAASVVDLLAPVR